MGSPEMFPQREESEAIGLSIEDFPDELDSKEAGVERLLNGLSDVEASQEETMTRIKQLEKIDRDIGVMKTMAQKEGGMLDTVERIDDMKSKIKSILEKH